MDEFKCRSIASTRLWKDSGKPRTGPIFQTYRKDKSAYKAAIRNHRREATEIYTNDLHEALLNKEGNAFWKCWRSKFGQSRQAPRQVDGIVDPSSIADYFAEHFSRVCDGAACPESERLRSVYDEMRSNYCGLPFINDYVIDTELVESVINKLDRGKAAGLDGVAAEHLQYSHPLLPVVLSKLFNLMLQAGHVPADFAKSYTVPILKGQCTALCKSINANDFRGIAISPVVSKVLEHCIIDRYCTFFVSSDNQFGFKKGFGCSHAVFTLRSVIDYYVASNSTVNVCALDLSKAFDKMNHCGLFIKLMERHIPVQLLQLLEFWFNSGLTCVRWGDLYSDFYCQACGIRQGGVLSPYLFALYIDSVIDKVRRNRAGCEIKRACVGIIVYADDILLVAPTVTALQLILDICESELNWLAMSINVGKSACLRIGKDYKTAPLCIKTSDGREIPWQNSIRYLGMYLIANKVFTCSFDNAKKCYYRAFNAIYSKIGGIASEEVIVEMLKMKCLPVLLYGIDVCPINRKQLKSFEYVLTSSLMRIFRTKSKDVVDDCMMFFGLTNMECNIERRKKRFVQKFCDIYKNNTICCIVSVRS